MRVIASPLGLVLYFETRKELKGVIKHLQGHLEWIEKENVEPPYLYSTFDDRIPTEEIDKMLDELKGQR